MGGRGSGGVRKHGRQRPSESGYANPALRFWKKVDTDGPVHPVHGPCFVWTAGIFKDNGYGQFSVYDKPVRAHRFSWELHFGPIPEGMGVLHHCDNRLCVRPDHLFLGSQDDNAKDMVAKGRQARGLTHHSVLNPDGVPRGARHKSVTKPETVSRGEDHGMAKLTAENVREIRATHKPYHPRFGTKPLAVKFGVSDVLIKLVTNRKIWKSVE